MKLILLISHSGASQHGQRVRCAICNSIFHFWFTNSISSCLTVDYAANLTATDTPAFAHKPTRQSSESLSTLLHAISEMRGCTTPRRLAASA